MKTILQILNETQCKINKKTGKKECSSIYHDIDKITRKMVSFVHALSKKQKTNNYKLDITEIFNENLNPHNRKVFFKYSNVTVSKKKILNHVIGNNGENITLVVQYHGTFSENITYDSYNTFQTLKHEMVHILDFLSLSDEETDDIEKENNKLNRNYTSASSVYYNDAFEFNQIINAIKEYSRLHPISWNKFLSADKGDINKIFTIIEKHGRGFHKFDDYLKKSYEFKTKLISRLEKDNIIPKKFIKVS